jgi:two-component system, OmpR family, sensor kinase
MPDSASRPAVTAKVALGRRLYVRFYIALLASLLAAAVLFGFAHLRFDPVGGGLSVGWPRMNVLGLVVMLFTIALVVAAGAFPFVRRLTRRLERLQHSVEVWGDGALATRVAVEGKDEVARLAASFNHSAARIETLVGAQKALLANASHELRSPLARIRLAAELMAGQATPAIGAELRRSVGELDQLIDEVLLASRLDAVGAILPPFEEVDLTGLVAEECARASATLDAAPHGLQGDARLLRRLVRNSAGSMLMLVATIIDGFISTDLAAAFVNGSPEAVRAGYWMVQAVAGVALTDIARVAWVCQSVAAVAWACALLRERGLTRKLGMLGLVAGTLPAIAVIAVGAGMTATVVVGILLVQAVWNLTAATYLLFGTKLALASAGSKPLSEIANHQAGAADDQNHPDRLHHPLGR